MSQLSLQYKVEELPSEALDFNQGSLRLRRYVPDSEPLDEYTHPTIGKDRLLADISLKDHIPTNRQSKENKFAGKFRL